MASRQHLSQLKKGAAAWNRWRSENARTVPDLKNARLGGMALAGANLSGALLAEADLSGADLSGSDLGGAVLLKADLRGACLDGARLRRTHLEMADMRQASLINADLTTAELKHADLTAARLGTADLSGADLSGARLERAGLAWSHLSRARLENADLRRAACREADFSGALLDGADLRGADLRFARLADARLRGVKYDRRGRFLGIGLAGASGSRRFMRFAARQDVIEELRAAGWWGKVRYGLWLVFADCGRTPWTWPLWCLLLVLCFAAGYYFGLGPEAFRGGVAPWRFDALLAFSLASFAGLDSGWLQPASPAARMLTAVEAFGGYLMLALLVATVADWWSRR